MYKTFAITATCTLFSIIQLPVAGAQDDIDIDARKRSVVNLEQHIADREERLADITGDIERLDERVEKYIDKIVARLKAIEDSEDSQVRVAQIKERAIDGLRKTIDYYAQKRNGIKSQLGKSAVSRETLEGDIAAFDQRIEKRVAQIIELTKSFAGHEELAKYITWSEETRRGRDDTKYRLNDEWLHNRKDFRHTEAQQKEVSEALAAGIERLEREVATLEGKLKTAGLSSGLRQIYEEELAHSESMIALRKGQLHDVSSASGRADTTPVDQGEALLIEKGLDDTRADLRQEFFAIFEKYAELSSEREQISKLKANLQARKEWLKNYEEAN